KDVAVTVADAAVVLGVVILQEHHRLVGRHDPPRLLGELIAGTAVGIELGNVFAVELAEFVAHPDKREFGDVGGPAGAVAFAEVVVRAERLAYAVPNDLEKNVGTRFAFSDHRVVDGAQNLVQVHLLDVFRRIDPESGDAEPRQRDQIAGDLLTD